MSRDVHGKYVYSDIKEKYKWLYLFKCENNFMDSDSRGFLDVLKLWGENMHYLCFMC
jgi:hypothetical protein